MIARYVPLVLQAPLNAMPYNYGKHIPQFDGTGTIRAQQHIDKMNDFIYLEEVDDDDVKLRIFSQILVGQVRKWYKGLAV